MPLYSSYHFFAIVGELDIIALIIKRGDIYE